MIVVGIDPGMTGAIAVFIDGQLDNIYDMPTFDGRVDGIELEGIITSTATDVVYMENTHPMPKNGSISSYKLGLNTGIVIGVVQSCAIPLVRISVAQWRAGVGLRTKGKDASLGLARELYPKFATQLRLAKHHNRAEAILIGRYGVYRNIHTQTGEAQDEHGRDRHPAAGRPRSAGRRDRGAESDAQSSERTDQDDGRRVVPLQPPAARR